jgi:hypothetical protein
MTTPPPPLSRMSVISPRALVALLDGKDDSEMVYVRVKDPTGYRYEGRVAAVQEVKGAPLSSTFDIQTTDGDLLCDVSVRRITHVDVRPFRRYDGYSAGDFVSSFGPGVS